VKRIFAWTLLVLVLACAAQAGVPMTLVSQEETARPENFGADGFRFFKLTFRNDSEKTVTARRFTCLRAPGEGRRYSSGYTEVDALFELVMPPEERRGQSELIRPGDVVEEVVTSEAAFFDHPYAALSCQYEAVLFDDGSSAGSREAVDGLFERRSKRAAEALVALRLIEELAALGDSADTPRSQALLEEVEQRVAGRKGAYWSWVEDAAALALGKGRAEGPTFANLRTGLVMDLQLLQRHLPRK